jgi:hypothetical protein
MLEEAFLWMNKSQVTDASNRNKIDGNSKFAVPYSQFLIELQYN